jgi:hypothetical protein
MCFAGEVEGGNILAAALKLAVGAQLARAKSEAFKLNLLNIALATATKY